MALRIQRRPPLMWRSPRRFPLSPSYGARPIKAAAISSLTWPSSGIPAMRLAEVVSAKPGTLSMISVRSAKSALALTLAAIAASSFSISAAKLFKTRACAFRTCPGAACASWLCSRVLISTRAMRAFTSATSSSCAASLVWLGASLNVSANQAIISASIASFLASRPADSAKAADPLGVDNPDLDASVVQHFAPFTLVTAACLHHRLAHLVLAEPGNQLAVTLCGVRAALPQCKCANARIHLALGDIDADDNEIVLCHHPLPSLLGSGSKPLQLFGLRKTPELSLALTQAYRFWGVTGSVPATGGFAETARSHILPDFLDTRGVSRSPRTLGAGSDGRGSVTRRMMLLAYGEVVWS